MIEISQLTTTAARDAGIDRTDGRRLRAEAARLGFMAVKVLLPTTVPLAVPPMTQVDFVPYDPALPVPEEHLDAEVLVIWGGGFRLLRDAAARMGSLRLVQTLASGAEQVLAAPFAPGVALANGRGLHDGPVAEHALALILAAARRLNLLVRAQIGHRWASEHGWSADAASIPPGGFTTLAGTRVTIWGFGSIASRLAPPLAALGAAVTGVARTAGERSGFPVVAEQELDALLPDTDVLVMILPDTPATRGALDAHRLGLLPAHAWLVNVGRGVTVDEEALIRALAESRLAGAALDVTAVEPLPTDSALWDMPNVILTPHGAGGRPVGAEDLIAHNLRALQTGTPLRNLLPH